MSRRGGAPVGVLLTLGLLVLLVSVAATSCRMAQTTPPPRPVALPQPGTDGYVGAETCQGCHAEAFAKFASTRMGRLFLHHPRNDLERAACENCHGPGKAHVEAGGGKGVGGMITFRKNDPTPLETRNGVCVQCHQRGPHLLWPGSAHEVARRRLHELPQGDGEHHGAVPARQGDRDGDVRPVPHREAGPADARLAHAPSRRQDDVHVLPQPPRLGRHQAPQGELAQRHLLPVSCGEARAVPVGARAGHRELRELPRPARLQPREHAEGRQAAPLPAVPRRDATSDATIRDGHPVAQVRPRPVLHHVSREIHGSNHPSGFAFTR